MRQENRFEPRVQVKLPLRLANGETGITRDVSTTGLFFEMDGDQSPDSEIDLSVGLSVHGRAVWLPSRGRVVRVEHHGNSTGIAVKLLTSSHTSALSSVLR